MPHSDEYDRLILDRRPQNSRERRLALLQLPLGALFTRVHLHGHRTLRSPRYDLSTYFTQLAENPSGLPCQAVGRPFYRHEFPGLRLDPCRLYVTCMLCLGMGDLNSTDIAQEVHIQALKDEDGVCDEGCLRWGFPLPLIQML